MAWLFDDINDAYVAIAAVRRIIRRHSLEINGSDLAVVEHIHHDIEALHRKFAPRVVEP